MLDKEKQSKMKFSKKIKYCKWSRRQDNVPVDILPQEPNGIP